MSNDFLGKPRGRWRLILAGAVAAAILIGLGAVIYRVIDNGAADTPQTEPGPSSSSSEVLGVDPDDLGALTVIPGSTTIDGVAVGYPHTIPGAVSAAAEYWAQIGSTLDPDRARRIGEIIADPAWTGGVDSIAGGPANSRKELGLPETGPVPQGASLVLAPVAYQLRDVTAGKMTVLLLGYLTATTPAKGTQSAVGVFTGSLRWVEGDWKYSQLLDGIDYSDLARTPNTTEAAAAGWKGLTR
ncbi:hypothetical protein [Phytomonospora endophytica]|uniref:DUF8175 domain-containing protein n=1 Tax=Phytomonospora endophytica TaxID=714109 RepID=A0A841FNK5_9ACTN|nr:hypothetical protein [Phytomonospora endophytica]MBB6037686.1 hypothetical protein [Phytomonospora endophytica]GIG67787.1 hypothetical protein Pen01_40820 [Phytomonospora endophytica]